MPIDIIATHIIPHLNGPGRLVDYACGIFPQLPSRKSVKKGFKKGLIYLNGAVVEGSRYAHTGDVLSLRRLIPPRVYARDIPVIWEDAHLALLIKPAGIPVSGHTFCTVARALPYNLMPGTTIDALDCPIPVHRLDAQTSGLLMVAKSSAAAASLGHMFEARQVHKTYMALVAGTPPDSGIYHTPIGGQAASTTFLKEATVPSLRHGTLSLLRLTPLTGRTHQLRIHLSQAGYPILGDALYGGVGTLSGKGLFLCAVGLRFAHPVFPEREIIQDIPLPRKFTTRMERENRRWRKYRD